MTASLPPEVQDVFANFVTTEYTTIAPGGMPITWPVTPYYTAGDRCIDTSTALGYPRKANDARVNPRVAMLFSDPTGSRLTRPPVVLVQGVADIDDRDLAANRERYAREFPVKLPGAESLLPPRPLRGLVNWYLTRIYIHVRPERVYVWEEGDLTREPVLFDTHMEEVRSGHHEEPDVPHVAPAGGDPAWDERIERLGTDFPTAVLSIVAPDGFPFSARIPVSVDRERRQVRLGLAPVGAPLAPGLACLTAHQHEPTMRWMRNFQVRGDLVRDESGWAVVPHRLVGGFEMPPTSTLDRYRRNLGKFIAFRRNAARELERREERRAAASGS